MGRRITGALGNRPGAWAAAALLVLAAALFAVLELSRPHVDGDRLRLDTFYGYIDDGRIRSAEILDQDSYVVGDYDAGSGAVAEYAVALPSEGLERKDTIDRLVENDVPTEINDQFLKGFREEALMIIPSLMVVVVIIYFVVSMARGTGLFGSGSGARRVSSSERRASFGEIGGASEAIEELAEVRQYLEDPERFARLGARIPRGYQLTGPRPVRGGARARAGYRLHRRDRRHWCAPRRVAGRSSRARADPQPDPDRARRLRRAFRCDRHGGDEQGRHPRSGARPPRPF